MQMLCLYLPDHFFLGITKPWCSSLFPISLVDSALHAIGVDTHDWDSFWLYLGYLHIVKKRLKDIFNQTYGYM